ncbi:MAG TPA: universal stress protein [Ktedonobacterales bacterium]|nr:universal stress protein [Ktedonobacterales bacterium]
MMFKRILVPVDGSFRSEAAIPAAARLARRVGGSVVLLRAVSAPLAYAFPLGPASVDPALLDEELRAVEAYLTHLADLPAFSGIEKKTVMVTGPAVDAILETATGERCDSIVMTTHGRTGLSRWALGSVARQISRWAPVPTLLLRATGASATPLFEPEASSSQGVLVPLDGSPLAEEALEPAIELAQAIASPHSGCVHVLLALWPSETQPDNMPEGLALTGAQTYLQNLVSRYQDRQPPIQITWSVVSNFDPASAILHAAEGKVDEPVITSPDSFDANRVGSGEQSAMRGFSAIAMASHGRTGPNLWIMGSFAERVLDATRLPVLIAHTPTDLDDGASS